MLKHELNILFDLSISIDHNTANLQTNTCFNLINLLQDSPGVILGDDVGMGKTYIAIATAIYYLYKFPEKQIVIITPNWMLNDKWYKDISNFIDNNIKTAVLNLSKSDIAYISNGNEDCGTYVNQIKQKSMNSKILLIPINVLSNISWKYEKSFFLSCWFRHKRLWGKTREKVLNALDGDVNVRDPYEFKNMGMSYEEIDESWYEDLDKIDISKNELDKVTVNSIWNEVKELRYRVINKILPRASLLILDEAHKMKNEATVRRQSLQNTVVNKFDRAVFLTATPFQLHDSELQSVLSLFESANIDRDKVIEYKNKVKNLFIEMDKYKHLINRFEIYIRMLTQAEGHDLEDMINGEIKNGISYDLKETYNLYEKVLVQKKSLELVMKQIIIRNVKAKDEYRHEIVGRIDISDMKVEKTGIPLDIESYLPFALMEKAIFEILAEGDRTFIANIKQSFTSSYEAAVNASIYSRELSSLDMLRQMDIIKNKHPKVESVVDEVVSALKNGEKTLIFCDRVETVKTLKNEIQNRLNKYQKRDTKKLFIETGDRGFENYYKRFYNKQDVSWLLLQENYIHSVLIPVIEICGKNLNIIPEVTDIEMEVGKLYRRYNTTVKANYMYLKRIVEHIVFNKTLLKINGWKKNVSKELKATIDNILNLDYIRLGLNLDIDEDEDDEENIEETEHELRTISSRIITNIINYKGIWSIYKEKLNQLGPVERDEIVSAMISFLRRDKRFFIELRSTNEKYADKEDSFCIDRTFKRGGLLDWDKAYERFIDNYCNETPTNKVEMKLGLKISDAVSSITGETTTEARLRIKAGFNTPFYPQVLIATSTMQEGIDLQIECKRVIHYDLEWNPASLEQRVGRVDRINSLISKLLYEDKDIKLDIFYPYIKNTIDESIYKTVKDREKWFNLILGGTPQWDTFEIDPDVISLSPQVFKNLQIDLGVKDEAIALG